MELDDFLAALSGRISENEFIHALSRMGMQDFVRVLTTLADAWGKDAAHYAFAMVRNEPENREAITRMITLAHRCCAVSGVLERIAAPEHELDPSQDEIQTSIERVFRAVRTGKLE